MTIAIRKLADSWPVVATAMAIALSLSLGGVRIAGAEGPLMSQDKPQKARRSVEAVVTGDADQCQAGPRGEANLRAEYARKMEAVKRRLEAQGAPSGVITLNSRGHNYGPAPAPSLPLDARPAAPGSPRP